jgi:uncharacterized lipoprotein YddW (UPF0748 family)
MNLISTKTSSKILRSELLQLNFLPALLNRRLSMFLNLLLASTLTSCVSSQVIKGKTPPTKFPESSPLPTENSPPNSNPPQSPKRQTFKLTAWFTAADKYAKQNSDVATLMRKAKLLGVEKIYVSVWGQGCTSFRSQTMTLNGGIEVCPGFDWLTPLKNAAKSEGVTLIPWLEWGLHVPKDNPLYTKGKLSIIEAETKASIEVWQGMSAPRLNPFTASSTTFFSDLIIESAKFFDANEVQICDNHALKKSQLVALGKTALDFEVSFSKMIQKPNELGIKISLAALEHIAANSEYGINWPDWRSKGLVSEVISELYHFRSNPNGFASKALEEVGKGADQIGVYVGGAGGWTDEQIYSFASTTRSLNAGLALFEIGNFVANKNDSEIIDFYHRLNK